MSRKMMSHIDIVNKLIKPVVLLFLAVMLMGVAGYSSASEPTPDHPAIQASGGELIIALNNPPIHFNPALQSGTLTGMVGTQLFAGLIRFDGEGNPQPYLAKKWSISEDGLSVTFELVAGSRFHDGLPITSEDVAFSIEMVKRYHPFRSMLSAVKAVETPSPDQVVLRLSMPHPAILLAMSSILLPILPKHIYGDGRDILTHPANVSPVGSGPFKLAKFEPGAEIVLRRNTDYFIKGRPLLDQVTFKIYPDPDEIQLALEQGDVHMASFFPGVDQQVQLALHPNLKVTNDGFEAIGPMLWLEFNLEKKPFDDQRVRKAFAYAIDKNFITQEILGGKASKMTGPIVPTNRFYTSKVEPYDLDIEKANDLLEQAGYPRAQDGKRFSVTIDYPPDAASMVVPLLKYLRHTLARTIGVELKIRRCSNFPIWAQRVANGEFQATIDVVFTWSDPVIGIHRTYDSRNIHKGRVWSNMSKYHNTTVDQLLDMAASEPDFANRQRYYSDFQKILVDELPILWLSTVPYATIYDNDLQGFGDSIWGLMSPLDQYFWRRKGATIL